MLSYIDVLKLLVGQKLVPLALIKLSCHLVFWYRTQGVSKSITATLKIITFFFKRHKPGDGVPRQQRYETVGSRDKAELWLLKDFKLNPQIKRVSYKYLWCSPQFYTSYKLQ